MQTIHTKTKHTEWLSPEHMHDDSKLWLSELKFYKEEQIFLEELIKSYTLQLIDKKHYEDSKAIVKKLSEIVKQTEILLKTVTSHEKQLTIVVDGVDQLKEEAIYRKEHRNLIEIIAEFKKRYQSVKVKLFSLIKLVIKENKQKLILK